MDEINVLELLKYYLKKIKIITLVTILFLLVGLLYTKEIKTPLYHGSTTIILVAQNNSDVSAASQTNDLNLNQKLVTTYSEIIKSRRVLNKVIKKENLKLTVKELAKKIVVSSVSDTSIIKISVSDKNNKQAVLLANSISDIFKEEVVKIYNLENISIIDKATIEHDPYNISVVKTTGIIGLIGLVSVLSVLFVIYYFDNTIKNKKEIEEILNLAVISEIPEFNKEKVGA